MCRIFSMHPVYLSVEAGEGGEVGYSSLVLRTAIVVEGGEPAIIGYPSIAH